MITIDHHDNLWSSICLCTTTLVPLSGFCALTCTQYVIPVEYTLSEWCGCSTTSLLASATSMSRS